jgi:hypothetical protein
MATDCIAQLIFRFQQKSQPVVAAFDMPTPVRTAGRCCSRRSTAGWD